VHGIGPDTDDGSRRVGEFAIGTNEGITCFTRQILFDEIWSVTCAVEVRSG